MIKAEQIECKLIPVPRHLIPDCGVCLRFNTDAKDQVENILQGKLDFFEIKLLKYLLLKKGRIRMILP